VDWTTGLAVACFCGACASQYLGIYGFAIAQYVYLNQFGESMVSPVFRMFKDGPAGDEIEELTLAWVRYGMFVASFYAPSIWNNMWTAVKESSVYYLAPLAIIVGVGELFFKHFPTVERAYGKYRQLESEILHRRGLLLW